jgi:hypothetical protein
MNKSIKLLESLASDDNVKNHFMIRLFNTDALEVSRSASTTVDALGALRNMLAPYWNKQISELIYTDDNRQELIKLFGEPTNE